MTQETYKRMQWWRLCYHNTLPPVILRKLHKDLYFVHVCY